MASGYFLVTFEGEVYANSELYLTAVAGGERTFIKKLSIGAVTGTPILGETAYPLNEDQLAACRTYHPVEQDFDAAYRHLNVLSRETISQIQRGGCAGFPGAAVVTLEPDFNLQWFTYRHAVFFRVRDFKEARKYTMVPKMAVIRVYRCLYAAINAVDIQAETPIIATYR
jgi:hypothetical protein